MPRVFDGLGSGGEIQPISVSVNVNLRRQIHPVGDRLAPLSARVDTGGYALPIAFNEPRHVRRPTRIDAQR
jgi:hypothetical protein